MAYDFEAIVVIFISDVVEIDLNKFAAMGVTITDIRRERGVGLSL